MGSRDVWSRRGRRGSVIAAIGLVLAIAASAAVGAEPRRARRRTRPRRRSSPSGSGATTTRPARTSGSRTPSPRTRSNPNITIKVVAQGTDTFIATFQAAAAAKSGPDIAAQWATGPVLTQVWGGAITAISDLVPKSETSHWLNTSENTYDGKVWAMPLYLLGVPWVYNKALMAQAGITSRRRRGARSWRTAASSARRTSCRSRTATTLLDDAADAAGPELAERRRRGVDGKASFTAKKFAHFETGWKQMVDAKCFNDDVSSVGSRRRRRSSTPARSG